MFAVGHFPCFLFCLQRFCSDCIHFAFLLDDLADGLLFQGDGDIAIFRAAESDAEDATGITNVIIRVDIKIIIQRRANPARMIKHVWHRSDDFELSLRVASGIKGNIPNRQTLPQTCIEKQPWFEFRLKSCQMLEVLGKKQTESPQIS